MTHVSDGRRETGRVGAGRQGDGRSAEPCNPLYVTEESLSPCAVVFEEIASDRCHLFSGVEGSIQSVTEAKGGGLGAGQLAYNFKL